MTTSAAFRVLGPVTIGSGPREAVLAPCKPAVLLAMLLLGANTVVSRSTLQRALWDDDPPLAAKQALHTSMMRLRRTLEAHDVPGRTVETVPGGYRMTVADECLDLTRFRRTVASAAAQGTVELELRQLELALDLWDGTPLANVPSVMVQRDLLPGLLDERLRVAERVWELKLEQGRARDALPALWDAARRYPAHEHVAELLIDALHRTGRQAEALVEFHRIRQHLDDELGIDPGPGLQRLELAILRGDQPGGARPGRQRVEAGRVRAVRWPIVGRADAIRFMCDRLAEYPASPIVLTGPFGIGKTALARHVAELMAEQYTGGTTFVEMRDRAGTPLRGDGLDDVLIRPSTTGRRLVVLDDVADVDQAHEAVARVSGDDGVVLTSRTSLAGFLAREGGWLHRLGPLSDDETSTLLSTALGPDRAAAGEDLDRIAELCGRVPLALRIAAARILTQPTVPLADAYDRLAEDPLGRLSLPGDPSMSVTRRFDDAVAPLPDPLAVALQRLADAGPTVLSLDDCAALFGVPPKTAERYLDELVDACLVEPVPPRSYTLSDLVRLCARDGARAVRDTAPTSKG